MSGHSKWSTIKHKKAAIDSKRGKMFGHVGKMIRVAVKEGGSGDPEQNPTLRTALEKARSVNMPRTNIDRAIMKGLGQSANGARFEEVLYEGYGPMGVGLLVAAITDNRNRTGAEIRGIFEKFGGSLGGPGATAYLFKIEQGGAQVTVIVPIPVTDENARNKVLQMVEALEENDDVETITHNMQ